MQHISYKFKIQNQTSTKSICIYKQIGKHRKQVLSVLNGRIIITTQLYQQTNEKVLKKNFVLLKYNIFTVIVIKIYKKKSKTSANFQTCLVNSKVIIDCVNNIS